MHMRATWTISMLTTALLLFGCGDDGNPTTGGSQSGTGDDTTGTTTTTTNAGTTTTTGDPPTTGPSSASQSGTGDPTTGVQPECVVDSDCPDMGPCLERFCSDGACGYDGVPEDSVVADVPGDCRVTVCDGGGGTKEVPADDDAPPQVMGDCKLAVCAQGNVEFAVTDDDLPNDDNDCTVDGCMLGQPTFTAKAVHSPCGPMGASFCHSDASCQKCKEVSDACEDFGSEPHETQQTSFSLGEITDADDDGGFVCGTVKGAADVDWYTYAGVDAFLNVVDPSRSLIAEADAARLCVYIQCDKGGTQVGCAAPDTADTAPNGAKGCCGFGVVSPSLNCNGLDDSARVWIRVDNPDMLACVPYRLDFHF